MADLNDLVNALIAMVPDDGGRITNDEIRAALGNAYGDPPSTALQQFLALQQQPSVRGLRPVPQPPVRP